MPNMCSDVFIGASDSVMGRKKEMISAELAFAISHLHNRKRFDPGKGLANRMRLIGAFVHEEGAGAGILLLIVGP